MDALREWFEKYSAREQAYLLAAAIVVLLYVLFMGIWKPLAGMREDMAMRNAVTQETLSRVQAMASGGTRVSRNMNQLINASTADVGIRPTRIQPNSRGETSIRFENVGFAELLRWMYRIEYGEGIAIQEAAINQGDKGGLVKATIRLGPG